MDAVYYHYHSTQYEMKYIERELLKAYTSFRAPAEDPSSEMGIATGNWGCGAFNGDRQLKGMNCFVKFRRLLHSQNAFSNYSVDGCF